MNAEEFQKYLEANHIVFAQWGSFVSSKIREVLKANLNIEDSNQFVKIPTVPRVKEINSALGKIARKGYTNPVSQMTDLVGVRFVVLLTDHVKTICKIIESESCWLSVLSKDYQEEIDKNPKFFDYQSQHYEVRPKSNFEFEFEGCLITTDICCEVQVRTLLQHTYAELVHDSIYKPVGSVPKKAERQVARSMALMETTDELFCNTMNLLTETNKPRNDFLADLTALFREKISGHLLRTDEKTNFALFDEFRESIQNSLSAEISELLDKKKYIPINIKRRAPSNAFFSQPGVLFAYWLAANIDRNELHGRWPLPGYYNELDLILSDMDA